MDKGRGHFDKVLSILLLIVIAGAIATLAYVIPNARGKDFTEFYLLGPGRKASDYPTTVAPGNKAQVVVGIVNREKGPTAYKTTMTINEKELALDGLIMLDPGQKWEREVSFAFDAPGPGQRVEFNLYRNETTVPHQKLYLLVDVR